MQVATAVRDDRGRFAPGNEYQRVARRIERRLSIVVARDDEKALDAACTRLLQTAAHHPNPAHATAAFIVIRDTLDGRPNQRVEVSANHTHTIAAVSTAQLLAELLEAQGAQQALTVDHVDALPTADVVTHLDSQPSQEYVPTKPSVVSASSPKMKVGARSAKRRK